MKVKVKLPTKPGSRREGSGDGDARADEAPAPPPQQPPQPPPPPSTTVAAHLAALTRSPYLDPPPADLQARWAGVLAGVRCLTAAAGDGCLEAVTAALVDRCYASPPPPASSPADRNLLDEVLAVAVSALPPALVRTGLIPPLAAAVGAGRVSYARRAPPFHALVTACGGGGGIQDDGGSEDDEIEGVPDADDGPSAVLDAVAAAAAAGASTPAPLAAWTADALTACPAGRVRAARVARVVRACPALAVAAAGRAAHALAGLTAVAALGVVASPLPPDLDALVAALASSGQPADVGAGVRVALRLDLPDRAAEFVGAVAAAAAAGGGKAPDPAGSARVGAAVRALAAAGTAPATPVLEILLSRPGLEAALDPADAVAGVAGAGANVPGAVAAWARAAAAWLGPAAAAMSTDSDLTTVTDRAVWLVQCAAVAAVAGGGGGRATTTNPPLDLSEVLASGLGAAGAALPPPAASKVAAALLVQPGVPAEVGMAAARALAVGSGEADAVVEAAGAAAVRAAAVDALVGSSRGYRVHSLLTRTPRRGLGVVRALAALAAVKGR